MNALLLDSHVWLWMEGDPDRLPGELRELLSKSETDLFLSTASIWEIAIKHRLGKLGLPEPPEIYIPDRMARNSVHRLDITADHALSAAALPMHHADPFDRMVIAQARLRGLTIATADRVFERYDVSLVMA